jgi:sulfur carrier protein ThiS
MKAFLLVGVEKGIMLVNDARKGPISVKASRVADLLRELGENEQTVLVSVNGTLATQDAELKQGDRVIIIPVTSGG